MASIAVIGTGYVGLVSGACLADFGNTVIYAMSSKPASGSKGSPSGLLAAWASTMR